MSKNRYFNTHFWDDTFIVDLDPTEKLLFIYTITNPLLNIAGMYEIPIKRMAFDTGIDKDMVIKILSRFEEQGKMKYQDGWLVIKNFIKHQKINPNIQKGIDINMGSAPKWCIDYINKAFESLVKPSNYINTNTNLNSNSNTNTNSNLNTNSNEDSSTNVHERNTTDLDFDLNHDLAEEESFNESEKFEKAIKSVKAISSDIKLAFNSFWSAYDKKSSRDNCYKKFVKLKEPDIKAILDHVPKYVDATPDKQYRKNPLTYLNQKCWNDEIVKRKPKNETADDYIDRIYSDPDIKKFLAKK